MAEQIEGGAVAVQAHHEHTEEEVKAKLAAKEQESLEVIKEDICQWLTTVLDPLKVTPGTFMDTLDTGVALCKLASLIQQNTKTAKEKFDFFVPMEPLSCNQKAGPGTFFARDNTSNFIDWCRKLSVEEAVIFESEGLVSHKDEKRVILCLLDVARFAEKVGMTAPQLIKMEREIDLLESKETTPVLESNSEQLKQPKRNGKAKKKIDDMVLQVVKKCSCSTNALNAVHHGNGKFIITGGRIRDKKTLHARLLSDRIMVRVGGGWDTLDRFLFEHDPCRIQQILLFDSQLQPERKTSNQARHRRSSTPGDRSPSPYKRSPSPYRRSPSPSPYRRSPSPSPYRRSPSPFKH